MKQRLLTLIRFYQRYLSLNTGMICRFSPTCSEYTYQAVNCYGIIRGLYLGLRRILRCHPWDQGGYDPVPHHL